MKYVKYFLSGFLSTIIFHQGLLYILHQAKVVPVAAYSFKSTAPLGVPAVLSLAFFGGLWGIVLGRALYPATTKHYWLKSFLFGAFLPTIAAIAFVFPLKEIEVTPSRVFLGMLLNGVWGLGSAAFIQVSEKYPVTRSFSRERLQS